LTRIRLDRRLRAVIFTLVVAVLVVVLLVTTQGRLWGSHADGAECVQRMQSGPPPGNPPANGAANACPV
jgi:hypothetical protein